MATDESLVTQSYCYLTTRGRITGRPHTIEIWFGLEGSTLYMLAGNPRSDWVMNVLRSPAVSVRIGERSFEGSARVVDAGSEEDARARQLLFDKYQPTYSGDLAGWRRTAQPVAVDLDVQPA
jgi:deazaflavin-dependent oxidoreductase (nitroreductase family)